MKRDLSGGDNRINDNNRINDSNSGDDGNNCCAWISYTCSPRASSAVLSMQFPILIMRSWIEGCSDSVLFAAPYTPATPVGSLASFSAPAFALLHLTSPVFHGTVVEQWEIYIKVEARQNDEKISIKVTFTGYILC